MTAEMPLVWRCDRTGNPVGTDTRMVGAPPCECQGCRASVLASTHTRAMEALREVVAAIRLNANKADVKGANATNIEERQFWSGRYSGLIQAAEEIDAALTPGCVNPSDTLSSGEETS